MIKRVPVTRDPDGSLRVICGEDILEIVETPPQDLHGFHLSRNNPYMVWDHGPTPEIWRNPNDETVMLARPASLDVGGTSMMMSALRQAYENAAVPHPTTLIVGVNSIDLHGAVHFAHRMQQQFPDIGFSIDLGLSRGPYG
jgi:hypothetical protein